MNDAQNVKYAQMVLPQSIGTSAVTGYIDTLGWDHLRVLYIGDTAASGDVITTLKLQDGSTTSAFTDISGAAPSTIPVPNTSTGDITVFDVSMAGNGDLERYINISIAGDATARLTSVIGILSRGRIAPNTDAEAGASEIVYV